MASFLSIKSTITNIHLLQTRGLMVTASEDKQIKASNIFIHGYELFVYRFGI